MTPLNLAIAAGPNLDPTSREALDAVDSAAARQASAWTTPEFSHATDGSESGLTLTDGTALYHYVCLAEPKK